jgi:formimidoylglutamate deiminase
MLAHINPSTRFSEVQTVWAEQALTVDGWQSGVLVTVGDDGHIAAVASRTEPQGQRVGVLLPAPANLHSHAFQRAMAGLTEKRGPAGKDSFWTWRELMYRFLDQITPDDVEAIAAFVQMEMLEAGYAAVGEFHYLHHQPDGTPYASLAEMSQRIAAAAAATGIGLTLLPVFYEHGGCDGRALGAGQVRFGNDPERFGQLFEDAKDALSRLPGDARIGIAPHSLRAVSRDGLRFTSGLAVSIPIHIHVAEQLAEVEEVTASWGQRPVEWLLDHHAVSANWCLIHATQMLPHETEALAKSGAVAGLCPITEANLGDGIFDAARYLAHGGRFGVGSDSNIRISLTEELRTLENSQRLRDHARVVLAEPTASTGRILFEGAVFGGAQAAGRNAGAIETGRLADLLALDADATDLLGKRGDDILDSWIFAGDDRMVTDVWSAGRHLVTNGRHKAHDILAERYRKTVLSLRGRL